MDFYLFDVKRASDVRRTSKVPRCRRPKSALILKRRACVKALAFAAGGASWAEAVGIRQARRSDHKTLLDGYAESAWLRRIARQVATRNFVTSGRFAVQRRRCITQDQDNRLAIADEPTNAVFARPKPSESFTYTKATAAVDVRSSHCLDQIRTGKAALRFDRGRVESVGINK
jgi:hypothetical protein